MSIEKSILKRIELLSGNPISQSEFDSLRDKFSENNLTDEIFKLMHKYPLASSFFALSDEYDLSEMGVEMKWMDAAEILSEAFDAYPGKLAVDLGYITIGNCMEGSGDPYFVKYCDGKVKLYRIPHDEAIVGERFVESAVELVSDDLCEFFGDAE